MEKLSEKTNQSLEGKKVLIIDDEADICDLLKDVLSDEGVETFSTEDGEAALDFLKENQVDCVLSDVWMPKIDGISLINEIRSLKNCENLPIIMMSGHGTIESAVEATKKGVYDFIEKPLSIERLVLCVQNAINHYALIQENAYLKKQSAEYVEPIGKSKTFEAQKQKALELASIGDWAIIIGERGCGKNTYARFIHNHSKNASAIYIHFNANEFFSNELELFANIKEIENEHQFATIVIENADELSETAQEQLHHHIRQQQGFRFILLAQSDENLILPLKKQTIYNGLYLTPLRKNLDDIDELIRFYTDLITKQEGLNYRRFNFAAQNLLRNYTWPGNVEELIYLIRKLLVLGGGIQIEVSEVEQHLANIQKKQNSTTQKIDFEEPLRTARDQFEKEYFLYHLRKVKGNISKLTTITGMERTSIHRKIKQLGINYKDF